MTVRPNIVKPLIALMCAVLLASCAEDVITIDLDSASPRIVIEGRVMDGAGPQTVRITRTTDFFTPGDYQPVTDAAVVIGDDTGASATLDEVEPGTYATTAVAGVPGRTYTLAVTVDGTVYRAVSTMHEPSRLDSLAFEVDDEGERIYIVHGHFTDRPAIPEYFRFLVHLNGARIEGYYLYQDRLTDGNAIDYTMYIVDEETIRNGDLVEVVMEAIDRPVYRYFRTLGDAIADDGGGMFSGTPGNPTSNLTGGALGYFAAVAVTVDSLRVRK